MKKYIALIVLSSLFLASCVKHPKVTVEEKKEVVSTQPFTDGVPIQIEFEKGEEYYYPLMVFWIEDLEGNYIETLYASKSISTGVFKYGVNVKGKWTAGERRRPAALPYWSHKRGFVAPDGLYLPTPQNPLPDAITGATPKASFILNTTAKPGIQKFRVMMEVNQTWDWNNHWHNNLYPDDDEYKTSCQPALLYMAEIDLNSQVNNFVLTLIGHSHYSGKTGELFPDISTLTTALRIAEKVTVTLVKVD